MTRRLSAGVLLAFVAAAPTIATDEDTLRHSGYQTLWEGYARITTCVDDGDRYPMGSFIFICDRFNYEYPYHYDEVRLLALPGIAAGYLCLDEDDDCLAGTIVSH